jgi:hypothetical protein
MSLSVAVVAAVAIAAKPSRYDPTPEMRRDVAKYAACVAKLRPQVATRVVLQRSDRQLDRDYERIRLSTCVPGFNLRIYMSAGMEQFVLADALIRAKHMTLPADLSTIPPLNQGSSRSEIARALSAKGKRATDSEKRDAMRAAVATEISRFGECVVRASPQGAQRLLQTDVTSPEEEMAFRGLSKAFGACLDKGQQVTLPKDVVRGTIAFNYFRLAHPEQQRGTAK